MNETGVIIDYAATPDPGGRAMKFHELLIRLLGLTILLTTVFAIVGFGLSFVVGMIVYPDAVVYTFSGGTINSREIEGFRSMRMLVTVAFAFAGVLSAQTIVIVRAIEQTRLP